MKKAVFAVLAAFVMSMGFMSCSSSSPEDKMVSLMEDAISIMKSTHIKSADDVKTLTEKFATIKADIEQVTTEMMEAYKDKSPEELMKLAESMEKMEKKVEKMTKDMQKEAERLEQEAEKAGVSLDGLDIFD